MNSVRSNNLNLRWQRFTSSGWKDIEIKKFEFLTKTQFLNGDKTHFSNKQVVLQGRKSNKSVQWKTCIMSKNNNEKIKTETNGSVNSGAYSGICLGGLTPPPPPKCASRVLLLKPRKINRVKDSFKKRVFKFIKIKSWSRQQLSWLGKLWSDKSLNLY